MFKRFLEKPVCLALRCWDRKSLSHVTLASPPLMSAVPEWKLQRVKLSHKIRMRQRRVIMNCQSWRAALWEPQIDLSVLLLRGEAPPLCNVRLSFADDHLQTTEAAAGLSAGQSYTGLFHTERLCISPNVKLKNVKCFPSADPVVHMNDVCRFYRCVFTFWIINSVLWSIIHWNQNWKHFMTSFDS